MHTGVGKELNHHESSSTPQERIQRTLQATLSIMSLPRIQKEGEALTPAALQKPRENMRNGVVNCEMVLKRQDADWELLPDSCDQVPEQTPEHPPDTEAGGTD